MQCMSLAGTHITHCPVQNLYEVVYILLSSHHYTIDTYSKKSLSHFEITSIKLIFANVDFLGPYCTQQLDVWKKK